MPLAPSSIVVVRSPVWSWMRAHDVVVRAARTGGTGSTHRDRGGEREQRERHVEDEEHAEDRRHLHDDQHEEDRAEADEAAHDREVGHRARQQLARLPAVVEADVEALELRVEVVAQRGLELGRDGGEQDAPA